MQNYQKCYYKHFYTVSPDGVHTEVSQQECFAPGVDPSPDCPFKQRWFYDREAGYALRLPRDAYGEKLGKRNAADRKKQERVEAKSLKYSTIELGKPIGYRDCSTTIYTELEDDGADIDVMYEEKARFNLLNDFLNTLSDNDRELWEMMKDKARKQDIAETFQISLAGVRHREKRLKGIVRANPQLKSYYTDD